MRQVWAVLAFAALVLLAVQTALIMRERDGYPKAVVAAARLEACADIAAVAADFRTKAALARQKARSGPLDTETFEILTDAPREVARVAAAGGAILPAETFADALVVMDDAAQKTVTALFQGDAERTQRLVDDFDEAARAVSEACRGEIQRSWLTR